RRPYFRAHRLVVFSRRTHRPASRGRHRGHHRGHPVPGAIGGESGGKSMSLLAWALVIVSQLALVAGQIFLKRAMSRREHGGEKARGWIGMLVIGIATMTVWFLLWLGVMPHVELSKQM